MDNVTVKPSKTYKLKVPALSNAVYFTIVDDDDQPAAMFVNSKQMENFQWITALMTSFARQLEEGRPVEKIVADMKEVFDPKDGNYIIPGSGGKRVNSIVHHLGLVLQDHVASAKYKPLGESKLPCFIGPMID